MPAAPNSARPPSREQDREVGAVDRAASIKIRRARVTPCREEQRQVGAIHTTPAVEIRGTGVERDGEGRDPLRAARPASTYPEAVAVPHGQRHRGAPTRTLRRVVAAHEPCRQVAEAVGEGTACIHLEPCVEGDVAACRERGDTRRRWDIAKEDVRQERFLLGCRAVVGDRKPAQRANGRKGVNALAYFGQHRVEVAGVVDHDPVELGAAGVGKAERAQLRRSRDEVGASVVRHVTRGQGAPEAGSGEA